MIIDDTVSTTDTKEYKSLAEPLADKKLTVDSKFVAAAARSGGKSFRYKGQLVTPMTAKKMLKPYFPNTTDIDDIMEGKMAGRSITGKSKFRLTAAKGALVTKATNSKSNKKARSGSTQYSCGLFKSK